MRRNEDGALEVLLLTSRETQRWIIPKGWPWAECQDHTAAKGEAYEEAGVSGKIGKTPIGSYKYMKRQDDGEIAVGVTVYLLTVEREHKTWPERKQRRRAWYSPRLAAELVQEEGLCSILLALATIPRTIRNRAAMSPHQPVLRPKRAASGR